MSTSVRVRVLLRDQLPGARRRRRSVALVQAALLRQDRLVGGRDAGSQVGVAVCRANFNAVMFSLSLSHRQHSLLKNITCQQTSLQTLRTSSELNQLTAWKSAQTARSTCGRIWRLIYRLRRRQRRRRRPRRSAGRASGSPPAATRTPPRPRRCRWPPLAGLHASSRRNLT